MFSPRKLLIISLAFLGFFLPTLASAATLYYNNATGDGVWTNSLNWWTNANFIGTNVLPTETDDVVISDALIASTTIPVSLTATFNTATFQNDAQNQINLTVTADSPTAATFQDTSINYGYIIGKATFTGNATSTNAGTITGDAVFEGADAINFSSNQGTVTGTATFNGYSLNTGTTGTAETTTTFTGHAYNDGEVVGNATFEGNDTYNNYLVDGLATFTGTAYTKDPTYAVGVSGTIFFSNEVTFQLTNNENWTSDARGWIFNGNMAMNAAHWVFNPGSVNTGYLNGLDATFASSTYALDPTGAVPGASVIFTQPNVTFTLSGSSVWSSDTSGWIFPDDAPPTWEFNGAAYNTGVIGAATFASSTYALDPTGTASSVKFTHDVTFTITDSIWATTIAGWTLEGTDNNWIFSGASINSGTIPKATFNDTSINSGTITGTATFTGTAYTSDPTGTATTKIFAPATGNTVTFTLTDASWTADTSLWDFAGHSASWVFDGPVMNGGTIATSTFNHDATNSGTVIGAADFRNNSLNDSPSGLVSGSATFDVTSRNLGTVTGTATFTGTAYTNTSTFGTYGQLAFSHPVTFTVTDSNWTADATDWTLPEGSRWIFNGSSQNLGTTTATTTFNNQSSNGNGGIDTVGAVVGPAFFNNYSSNYAAVVTGPAIFRNSSRNQGGIIDGDASFHDASICAGTVTGEADIYLPLPRPIGCTVDSGVVRYHDYGNSGSVFFNNKDTGGDTNWNNPANWWTDETFQSGHAVPTVADDVVVDGKYADFGSFDISIGEGPPAMARTVTFTGDASSYIPLTVTTGAYFVSGFNFGTVTGTSTFINGSNDSLGTVIGDAIFSGTGANSGIITGTATFKGSSSNRGTLTIAVFNDTSSNKNGTVTTAEFYDESYNSGATTDDDGNPLPAGVVTTGSFYDESYNQGSVTTGTFRGQSRNAGIVTTATFYNTSCNAAIMDLVGDVTFHDTSTNGANGYAECSMGGVGQAEMRSLAAEPSPLARVTSWITDLITPVSVLAGGGPQVPVGVGGDAVFYDNSRNLETVGGDAEFNDGIYNEGTVTGTATFTGTAYTLDPVGTVTGSITFTQPDIVFTITDTTWSADASQWHFTGTPLWIFYGDASGGNGGNIPNAIFDEIRPGVGAANYGIVASSTFNGAAINYGTVTGTATFTGTAYTMDPVGIVSEGETVTFTEPVIFNIGAQEWFAGTSSWHFDSTSKWIFNNAWNEGTVGDAIFTGSQSVNAGVVTGTADVYIYPAVTLGGTVTNGITYHPEPLYFAGTENNLWSNLNNWYTNAAFTTHPLAVPTAVDGTIYDTVFLYASTTLPADYAGDIYIRANGVTLNGDNHTIGGNVLGSGVNDGDNGFDFSLSNLNSGTVFAAGATGMMSINGGNGGTLNLTDVYVIDSVYVNGGDADLTTCGSSHGGTKGTLTAIRSSYNQLYDSAGGNATACRSHGGRGILPPTPPAPKTPNPKSGIGGNNTGGDSTTPASPPLLNRGGERGGGVLPSVGFFAKLRNLLNPLSLKNLPNPNLTLNQNLGVTHISNPLANLQPLAKTKLTPLPNLSHAFSARLTTFLALKNPHPNLTNLAAVSEATSTVSAPPPAPSPKERGNSAPQSPLPGGGFRWGVLEWLKSWF